MLKDELAQDVAYVRAMAEEGRDAPLIGGSMLVLFGLLLAVAYLLHWAFITEQFGTGLEAGVAVTWLCFGFGAGIGGFLVGGRMRKLPGASSLANRTDRAVWDHAALAIGAVIAGSLVRAALTQDDQSMNTIMAAAFGLYGVALGAASVVANQSWLRHFSLMSLVLSAALWAFLNEPWAYLIAAAGSALVLLAPGLVLLRRVRSPTAS